MADKWVDFLGADGKGQFNATHPACRRLLQHIINNLKPRQEISYPPTLVCSDDPGYENMDVAEVKFRLLATMALFDETCTSEGPLSANITVRANQVEHFNESVFFLMTVLAALGPVLCGERVETKREDQESASGSASAGPSIENDPIFWLGCRTESGRYLKCVQLLVTNLLKIREVETTAAFGATFGATFGDAFRIDDQKFTGMLHTYQDALSHVFQTPRIKGISHEKWLKETSGIRSIASDLSLSPKERLRLAEKRLAALGKPKWKERDWSHLFRA